MPWGGREGAGPGREEGKGGRTWLGKRAWEGEGQGERMSWEGGGLDRRAREGRL